MGTKIRTKISEKNAYYLDKYRYLELKNFCMQYPEWKRQANMIIGTASPCSIIESHHSNGTHSDTTSTYAIASLYFTERISMVDKAAKMAVGDWWKSMVTAVTEGLSYECIMARCQIPFCRDYWYEAYRHFFWELNKLRK